MIYKFNYKSLLIKMDIIEKTLFFIFSENILEFILNIFLMENYGEFRLMIKFMNNSTFNFISLKNIFILALMEEMLFRIPLLLLAKSTKYYIISKLFINTIFTLCHYRNSIYIKEIIIEKKLKLNFIKQNFILFCSVFYSGFILSDIALTEGFIIKSTIIHFLYNLFSSFIF